MAADAVLREGLSLASLSPEVRSVLRLTAPREAVDRDIVYVGARSPIRLAEFAALVAGTPEVGGVLIVQAPTGPRDIEGIEAIVAAARTISIPLLVCAMGETTGARHRRALADAGVAVFAAPEQAVRGFRHIVQNRRSRAAAQELPPSAVLEVAPDCAKAAASFAAARAAGRSTLDPAEAGEVLSAYGVAVNGGAADGSPPLAVITHLDPLFGPAIAFGPAELAADRAVDLPPLNLPLAHALIERARLPARLAADSEARIADVLVRVSQLLIDFPDIAELRLDPLRVGPKGVWVTGAHVRLRDATDPAWHLSLPPYPGELVTRFEAHGETLIVRPIRPEDAEAHERFFTRLHPQDIRFRFFSTIRELSREQIARLTQIDYDLEMALLAVREATGETVGVARLVREGETNEGEFAVVVEPAAKGMGIATYLLRRLFDWARNHGIRVVIGQVLAENQPMLALVRHLGFGLHATPHDASVVEARLVLEPTPAASLAE
jgi:RimJ/RimL family protein N-acetyltransferase